MHRPRRRPVVSLRRSGLRALRNALLASAAVAPLGLDAQLQPPDTGAMVLERLTEDRWIAADRDPAFVPKTRTDEAIRLWMIRSRGRGGGYRFLILRGGRYQADLSLDPRNRVTHVLLDPPAITYSLWDDAESRAAARRRALEGRGALLDLPASRFLAVPVPVPEGALVGGTRWTDTLTVEADPGEGLHERLDEVRHNEIVGDTILAGEGLPIVRTVSEVHYHSTAAAASASEARVERDLRGTVRGLVVLDTVHGVPGGGADTARWEGRAVLHPAGTDSLVSPVRYERTRRWSLRDSASWADSVRAGRPDRSGMLAFPPDSLAARIARGDAVAVDSLLARWKEADDPASREEIERRLLGWGGPGLHDRLQRLRLEVGDTAGALAKFLGSRTPQLEERDVAAFSPWLLDPERLWRNGLDPSRVYGNLATYLQGASPLVEPAQERWACAPGACRHLLAMRDSTDAPGYRDVALVLAFARDPARWEGELRARAAVGSSIAAQAIPLADGVGATWRASDHETMPAPGAEWRSWLAWMGGTVRFEGSHASALRVYAAETGRDPVEELEGRWPPEGDSARLVLGTILQGMGRMDPSAEEVAAELLSGSPGRIRLAQQVLRRRLGQSTERLPEDETIEILPPVIDSMLARGAAPWPGVPGFGNRGLGGTIFHAVPEARLPRFLIRDGLAPGVVAALHQPVQVVDSTTWAARPVRAGGVVLVVDPPSAWGDFATIRFEWRQLEPRSADEPPAGYAGGGSLDILRTREGWRVVGFELWIT